MKNGFVLMEIPKSCHDCRFGNLNLYDMSKNEVICQLNKDNPIPFEVARDEKPDWCAIAEIPNRKEPTRIPFAYGLPFEYTDYESGWNDCIKELIKRGSNA